MIDTSTYRPKGTLGVAIGTALISLPVILIALTSGSTSGRRRSPFYDQLSSIGLESWPASMLGLTAVVTAIALFAVHAALMPLIIRFDKPRGAPFVSSAADSVIAGLFGILAVPLAVALSAMGPALPAALIFTSATLVALSLFPARGKLEVFVPAPIHVDPGFGVDETVRTGPLSLTAGSAPAGR